VTAISTSSNKKAEAEAFGATHFINTSEPGALEAAKSSFDLVLNCVSGDVDWDLYMSLTGPFGRLCVLGVPNNPITIGAGQLIVGYRQLVGSLTGSSKDVKEMFEFSAKHGITPLVEELPFAELEKAVEKVEKNTMRYRMVLNIAKSEEK
jgi:uncharacterized zinc-type alcohol dehydrogenase-like protein